MNEPGHDIFPELMQMNLALLETLRQEAWEAFPALSQAYIEAVQRAIAQAQQETAADKKRVLTKQLRQLQVHDAEIAQRIASRQKVLTMQMSKLHQSKTCCREYAAQMSRR
ncbi:protein FliT [Enterobacter sp. BIGb0383]|uniref:flagellar protein FliT n=1 Tax=unclassified Enterobacter TaxID=2608935 RepID=UPI000F4605DE|nr:MULTISPECIES: flagellar protein FliT [unclassified Enterobacter]ROP58319.1 protein FliT [Enterobacter sp. BIGb0383]ROS06793.1 protein FliT [Enterobacter sp. BIGb0359]